MIDQFDKTDDTALGERGDDEHSRLAHDSGALITAESPGAMVASAHASSDSVTGGAAAVPHAASQLPAALLKKRYALSLREAEARTNIEENAFYTFTALLEWEQEEYAALWDAENEAERALEARLAQRAHMDEAAYAMTDAELRERGRMAWQDEKQRKKLHQEEMARQAQEAAARKRMQNASVVFLITEERRYREFVEQDMRRSYDSLKQEERKHRVDTEHAAYELFYNNPDAVAKRSREMKKRDKLYAAALAIVQAHEEDQQKLMASCHHGKGNQSILTNPPAKMLCPRCRVKFDKTRGYWVRSGSSRLSLDTRHKEFTEASATVEHIQKLLSAEEERARLQHEYFDNYSTEVTLDSFFPQYYTAPSRTASRSASASSAPGGGRQGSTSLQQLLPRNVTAPAAPTRGRSRQSRESLPPLAPAKMAGKNKNTVKSDGKRIPPSSEIPRAASASTPAAAPATARVEEAAPSQRCASAC